MDFISKGWFTELSPDSHPHQANSENRPSLKNTEIDQNQSQENKGWQGQAFSLKVSEILYHEKSTYQDILVFKSETYGTVLVLDGVIQCTERDEFSYQEMLAHIPMSLNHQAKKVFRILLQKTNYKISANVLIIGGGDGGILREVLKHPNVESAVLCEIDDKVIEVCRKYLPSMSKCFDNPKVKLHIGDGLKFMEDNKNQFDVIITDSSDPIGPAETLFGESYYKLLQAALTDKGILASQAESIWLHLDLIKRLVTFCRSMFPIVGYAYSSVPTYPSGVIGYLICSKDPHCVPHEPKLNLTNDHDTPMNLRYYSTDVHRASFVLPSFAKNVLFPNDERPAKMNY